MEGRVVDRTTETGITKGGDILVDVSASCNLKTTGLASGFQVTKKPSVKKLTAFGPSDWIRTSGLLNPIDLPS